MVPIQFWFQGAFSGTADFLPSVIMFGLFPTLACLVVYVAAPSGNRLVRYLAWAQAVVLGVATMWPGEYYILNWPHWEASIIFSFLFCGLSFWILSVVATVNLVKSRREPKQLRWKAALELLGAFAVGITAKHILVFLTWQ